MVGNLRSCALLADGGIPKLSLAASTSEVVRLINSSRLSHRSRSLSAPPPTLSDSGRRHRRRRSLDQFDELQQLHASKACTLRLARCRASGMVMVIKRFRLHAMSPLNQAQLRREVALHSRLQHADITAMYAAFEDRGRACLLLEHAQGERPPDVPERCRATQPIVQRQAARTG